MPLFFTGGQIDRRMQRTGHRPHHQEKGKEFNERIAQLGCGLDAKGLGILGVVDFDRLIEMGRKPLPGKADFLQFRIPAVQDVAQPLDRHLRCLIPFPSDNPYRRTLSLGDHLRQIRWNDQHGIDLALMHGGFIIGIERSNNDRAKLRQCAEVIGKEFSIDDERRKIFRSIGLDDQD